MGNKSSGVMHGCSVTFGKIVHESGIVNRGALFAVAWSFGVTDSNLISNMSQVSHCSADLTFLWPRPINLAPAE